MHSNESIVPKEGYLYPVLKKMEQLKLIKSYWNVNDVNRPKKFYKIMPRGQKYLQEPGETKRVS